MRRLFLLILLLAILPAFRAGAASPDTLRFARLGDKLDEYLKAIADAPLSDQEAECDFLISSCQDSLDRQFVTVRLYDRYLNAKWMGSENVAVHIADSWILNGKVAMYNELDYINTFAFAEFNRSSLIGKKAPGLLLKDRSEADVQVAPEGGNGRYTALYFYAPGCATCRVTSSALVRTLTAWKEDVDLVAVNVDADPAAYDAFLSSHPDFAALGVHAWDPTGDSDLQRLYGVTQTPQLLLLDPKGVIVGRRLDPPALQELLTATFDLYSGPRAEEAEMLMEKVLSVYPEASADDVMDVARLIRQRAGDDIRQYKTLTAALLRYTSTHRGHGLRFGADRLSREIIARPEIWSSSLDRLLVVEHARLLVSLMDDHAPIGKTVPSIRIHGTLMQGGASAAGRFRLHSFFFRSPDYIIFFQRGCEACDALMLTLGTFLATHPRTRVLLVDMDSLSSAYPDEAEAVLTHFDVSTLPHILQLDTHGAVVDKYLDTLE